ncbi:uncharacterized protein LOC119197492 isoform X2 [Pungitius pungitius]|uniref:uncharacterized protein LOC119197492 isoform X2 n=1 Tax=Pungitius pungitius TaxID=134920 RepID=UPI001887F09A|nr:uncharacterized protein LOC119197492 isoform X2 [Pungitius pungitius]
MFNYRIPSLDQMKVISLIDFTLILILSSYSKGEGWNIEVSRHINATKGSNMTIQCRFTVPKNECTESVKVFWKSPEQSTFNTFDKDQNAFIFHPNETFVLEKYRGKTQLVGNKSARNCSLKIVNISENIPNIYLRVIAKRDNYSFVKDFVSISVSGAIETGRGRGLLDKIQPTPISEATTTGPNKKTEQRNLVAISVPVVAILVLILVVGVVLGMKRKREASGQKQENSKVSEQKDIEEPVYINFEASPDQMDQSVDHVESIYANVDSSKL